MAAKKARKPPVAQVEAVTIAPTRFQKFESIRIDRAGIQNAPYNPRKIDSYAKKKLETNLRKTGLLAPVVVNRRTMHLVSGHQRLACLDVLEGSGDYAIDVALVDLTPKQEREQNLFMNNAAAMGDWDTAALAELFKQGDIDIEATGFDTIQLESMFGEATVVPMFEESSAPEAVQRTKGELDEMADAAREADRDEREPKAWGKGSPEDARRQREALRSRDDDGSNDTEFYTIVVFGCREEREKFMLGLGKAPDDKYVDGRFLSHKLGWDS